jgi:predicted aldo/keto reductase-like oxidoreductase
MKHRTLGKTGISVSALGFGAMRLPTLTKSESDIDQSQATAMIRHAIDSGVNYVDTAYVYHGGQSEAAVGKALAEGYREKVHLATKLPVWSVESTADCDRLFDEQLARLETDCVDFYLLHCLQQASWPKMRDVGVLDWAEKARAKGRIRYLGFSFHDTFELFQKIVDAYDWSICQIQYNYICEDVQAGMRGLEYAAAKGLGVVVMEPLFGGTLAVPPKPVQEIWDRAGGRSAVDMALRWVWNKPEVSLVLSGMSSMEQVRQNLASAARSGVGTLKPDDMELIGRVRDAYSELSPIPCTKCGYCTPCPHGVNIPQNFELSNQAAVLAGNSAVLCRNLYFSLSESEKAAACQECGLCEEHCPQQIPIREKLAGVAKQFA